MTAIRCTAPTRGHVPGSQAQRECPVHGDRARTSPLPAPPEPEPASERRQMVLPDGTVAEWWYRNGVLHREGGPAYVKRHPDGTVVEKRWYRNDKLHREDGPAYVERRPDGTVVEAWYRNDKLHREDGPAWVGRSRDGIVAEGWYRSGERHREDGPAWVERHPEGIVVEAWYKEGKLHREGGPARVRCSPDGTVTETWCLDDTEVGAWEVLGRYLTTRGVPGLSAEALKQIAKDVPWQRWDELGSDHPLVALWGTVHPSAEISAG